MDVFNSNLFTLRAMTAAINDLPYVPNRLGQLGIFREQGISTTVAMIEKRNNQLYLVENKPRGATAKQNEQELRDGIPLKCSHLPVEDRLMADEVQNVREFGTDNQLQAVETKRNEKLATMTRSLEATIEHHRIGAIKGIVYDADGTSVLYNLFDLFGISQEAEVDFNLDDWVASPETYKVTGAIRKKCSAVIRKIEDALGATPYSGIYSLASPEFFDDLVDHPESRDAFNRWMDGQALRDRVARRTFFYAGIMFEEYRGKVGNTSYIEAGKAHFFPTGAADNFVLNFAPANFIETVNTIGIPMYAKGVPDQAGRWIDIYAQSNPLAFCTRPKTLLKAKRT